jgi:hypothetical protein
MIHFVLLGGSSIAVTGGMNLSGLTETYLAAGVTIVVLYPTCIAYQALKRKHPKSLLQYI